MIVCSCYRRTDKDLEDEARKGTLWLDAVKNLPVSNKCGRCYHLTKSVFADARRAAGFPDEPEKRHLPKGDKHGAGSPEGDIPGGEGKHATSPEPNIPGSVDKQ